MTGIDHTHEELRKTLVALTRDLIIIPGTAGRPEDLAQGLEFIRNHMESLTHIQIHDYLYNNTPSLVVLPEQLDTPEILLCGHLDVIEHPDIRSYKSEVRDGRIIGPGAGDMKGGLAVLMELFRNFHTRYPEASLGLAVTTDEETGGESGIGHIVRHAGLRCAAAIIPDGGSLNEITVEEKGLIHLRLITRGHAAHAAFPWYGRNALEHLAEKLDRIRTFFEHLRDDTEDHWYPTCSATIVTAPNRTINRVPDYAEAELDIRFPPPHTVQSIVQDVKGVVGDSVELRIIISAEPTHLSPDPLFLSVTEEITGRPAGLVRISGASDGRFLAHHNIPVMMSRPRVGELHSDEEWIDIDSMVTYYRICERYLTLKLLE